MISILVPSRGRPENIRRLYESLETTTEGRWELLVRRDHDDPKWGEYETFPHLLYVTGERLLLSQLWNDLAVYALGDILMHGGDDITFATEGWDVQVREAMPDDGIAVVHGNDLSPNSHKISTHSFVSRKWVKTLGYICPPYFASDYNDLWLTEVADALHRRIYLPDVIIEHHHPAFGKGEWDQTHQERVERHEAENVDQIWVDTAAKRIEDAAKLEAVISQA